MSSPGLLVYLSFIFPRSRFLDAEAEAAEARSALCRFSCWLAFSVARSSELLLAVVMGHLLALESSLCFSFIAVFPFDPCDWQFSPGQIPAAAFGVHVTFPK